MSTEDFDNILREKDRLRKEKKKSSLDPAQLEILKAKNAESQKRCRKRRAEVDPSKAASIKQEDRDRKKAAAKTLQDALKEGDEVAIEQQKKRKIQKQMSDQYLKRRSNPSIWKEAGGPPRIDGSIIDLEASLRRRPTDSFKDANYKPGVFKTASWMQMQQAYHRIAWDQMSESLKKLHPLLIRRNCHTLSHYSKHPCKREEYQSWRKQYYDVYCSISDNDAFSNHEEFQQMLTKFGISDTHKYMRDVQLLPFNHPVLSKKEPSKLSDIWTEGIPLMFCNQHRIQWRVKRKKVSAECHILEKS